MKHELARIRVEAAALYAIAHPEVRLKDIGTAVGYSGDSATAVVMVSNAMKKLGYTRPRGAGSKAYDKTKIISVCTHDHDAIAAYVRDNPSMRQGEVAVKFGCDQSTVSTISREAGIYVGYNSEESKRRAASTRQIKTDEELRAYFAVPRPGFMKVHAEALGYAERGLTKALRRLGIKRRKK